MAAALQLGPRVRAQTPEAKPNIVLCMADDLGWGDVGYHGHEELKTPHIDAMAAAGLQCSNFFAAAPVCSPTRATCLTGRHHYRSGVTDHSEPINPDEPTIADALAAHGYRTALFGKWHLHGGRGMRIEREQSPFLPDQLGFHEWFATGNNAEKVDPRYYWHNGEPAPKQKGEDSRIIMDKALAFIDKQHRSDKPFFACIWFHTPHTPYGSTEKYLAQYKHIEDDKTRAYYAQITAMDEQIGRLRAELRRMKAADNTLLIFCSDNGAKAPGSNGPYDGRKGRTSEGGTRVPGLVEWPAVIDKPARTDAVVVTTDFYHTLLDAADIASFGPKRDFDGESFLPILKGSATHERLEPVRFLYRGRGAAVTPAGKWIPQKQDPGYDAWRRSVESDLKLSRTRIEAIEAQQ